MGEKGAYSTMKFIELSQEQQRIVFTQAVILNLLFFIPAAVLKSTAVLNLQR